MSHEITATDNVVLTGERAWHGLGIVVENAPSPREALKIGGLDWTVGRRKLWCKPAYNAPATMEIPDKYAVVRNDTNTVLGVVGGRYQCCQNTELADFCEALAHEGQGAKIETAGSIYGGRKVWLMLQSGSINVTQRDTVKPYLLVSSSHDGSSEIQVLMTSVRTVCKNTLSLATQTGKAVVNIRHSGNMQAKLDAAKRVVENFGKAVAFSAAKMNTLRDTATSVEDLQAFFAIAYQRDFGKIPADKSEKDMDKQELRQSKAAKEAFVAVVNRYNREREITGDTAWGILNAYTGYLQHDAKVRGANNAARAEKRLNQRLFGEIADRTDSAWNQVLALAS
jgi:phage/plasmid-like protein (TIGR03299 family)